MPITLQRGTLRHNVQQVIRKSRRWKPDVLLVKNEGRLFVVKDYADKEFAFRWFIGIPSIWREAHIYEKLRGTSGVPEGAHRIDRYAIAVAHVPGRNAEEAAPGALPAAFFEKMRGVIDAIHDRGIVLCDLRNIKNVLVAEDGAVYLIDFSTAFCRGGRFNVIKNGLFRIFWQDDLLGIAKLKRQRAPHLLTDGERKALAQGLPFEKQAGWIKKRGRRFLRFLFGWGKWEK